MNWNVLKWGKKNSPLESACVPFLHLHLFDEGIGKNLKNISIFYILSLGVFPCRSGYSLSHARYISTWTVIVYLTHWLKQLIGPECVRSVSFQCSSAFSTVPSLRMRVGYFYCRHSTWLIFVHAECDRFNWKVIVVGDVRARKASDGNATVCHWKWCATAAIPSKRLNTNKQQINKNSHRRCSHTN